MPAYFLVFSLGKFNSINYLCHEKKNPPVFHTVRIAGGGTRGLDCQIDVMNEMSD